MTYALLIAIGWSLAIILLLCRGDPKRRRTIGLAGPAHDTRARRLLGAAIFVPGLLLALSGDSASFLIWLGSCTVGGWLLALLSNDGPAPRASAGGRRPERD